MLSLYMRRLATTLSFMLLIITLFSIPKLRNVNRGQYVDEQPSFKIFYLFMYLLYTILFPYKLLFKIVNNSYINIIPNQNSICILNNALIILADLCVHCIRYEILLCRTAGVEGVKHILRMTLQLTLNNL